MADVKISFSCGCGFKTNSPTKAINHSDSQKHSLTINGSVDKPEAKTKN